MGAGVRARSAGGFCSDLASALRAEREKRGRERERECMCVCVFVCVYVYMYNKGLPALGWFSLFPPRF